LKYILVVILLFIGVVESIRYRKLTVPGATAGGLIGFFVFLGAGWTGLAMLAAFFLLGTLATSWKRQQKKTMGLAQEKGGQRKLGQVLANGGLGGLLGLLTLFLPQQTTLLALMMAGSFSSATADTLSSELGSIYGKRFYNILTLKIDRRGLDGVISLEGTLIGVAGSAVIAAIYCMGVGWTEHFFWIVIAGTAGNLFDSVLGATLERKQLISNDLVNFLNTALAAALLWLTA
jgi:uncharacterized protein (TIGR00297 family)